MATDGLATGGQSLWISSNDTASFWQSTVNSPVKWPMNSCSSLFDYLFLFPSAPPFKGGWREKRRHDSNNSGTWLKIDGSTPYIIHYRHSPIASIVLTRTHFLSLAWSKVRLWGCARTITRQDISAYSEVIPSKERCTLARAGCLRARTVGSAPGKLFTLVRVLVLNPENISLACSYVFWVWRGQNDQRTLDLLKIRLSHQISCKHHSRSMLYELSNIKSIAIIHHTSCICITQ